MKSCAAGAPVRHPTTEVHVDALAALRSGAERTRHQRLTSSRLTTERVSRIIASIGEEAGIVVRTFGGEEPRTKFASAHDIRRSVAERMINAGVSAETLMVIMRHRDFATTKKFYGHGAPPNQRPQKSSRN